MNKQQMGVCIGDYKKKVKELKEQLSKMEEERCFLVAENKDLKRMIHDVQLTNNMLKNNINQMRDDIEQEVAKECGCVVIEGASRNASYQDMVGILLANGYAVEVIPIQRGTKIKLVIKEGEE